MLWLNLAGAMHIISTWGHDAWVLLSVAAPVLVVAAAAIIGGPIATALAWSIGRRLAVMAVTTAAGMAVNELTRPPKRPSEGVGKPVGMAAGQELYERGSDQVWEGNTILPSKTPGDTTAVRDIWDRVKQTWQNRKGFSDSNDWYKDSHPHAEWEAKQIQKAGESGAVRAGPFLKIGYKTVGGILMAKDIWDAVQESAARWQYYQHESPNE